MKILCLCLLLMIPSQLFAEWTVQTIYFQPTDAPAANITKIHSHMTRAQRLFRTEMQDNGFEAKTFTLERDTRQQVIVHTIRGKHNTEYYRIDTFNKIRDELPRKFNAWYDNTRTIFCIFVGKLDLIGGVLGRGAANYAITDGCGACSGDATVPAETEMRTVAHELGHTFGLGHNLQGYQGKDYLMWTGYRLSAQEARWLDRHPYFNKSPVIQENPPTILETYPIETWTLKGEEYLLFRVDVTSHAVLRQAIMVRKSEDMVIAWDKIFGYVDTAQFLIPQEKIGADQDVWISFMDFDGNIKLHHIDLRIHPRTDTHRRNGTPVQRVPIDNETDTENIYLTIKSEHPKALQPSNREHEWDGWVAGVWEKGLDGEYPPKPGAYPGFRQQDTWQHWFYSHAPSRIVWDVKTEKDTEFSCTFLLAHPCDGNIASMEVSFIINQKEIYYAELYSAETTKEQISFEIPANTEKLTLRVGIIERDTCDHFVLGEPRLNTDAVPTAPRKPHRAIATTWASLKKNNDTF